MTDNHHTSARWTVAVCRTRLAIAEKQYETALRTELSRTIQRADARLAERTVDMIEAERRRAERGAKGQASGGSSRVA